jgi:hypothetical protein
MREGCGVDEDGTNTCVYENVGRAKINPGETRADTEDGS